MIDILEFKAFIKNDNFHFTEKMINDFIYFIESRSIYWGGGYERDFIQGGLSAEKKLNIDKNAFEKELVSFFQKLNKDIKIEIKQFDDPDVEMDYLRCYCCGYFTIEKRGSFEIYPVCYWEDDEYIDLETISNPNRMTLREGRKNFLEIGACSYEFIKYVEKNPERKFIKGNI